MAKTYPAALKRVPNALTISRIALSAGVFFLLAGAAGVIGPPPPPGAPPRSGLLVATAAVFVFAALTDFFDGWLARRLDAKSDWGVILDPIADKIAIAAAVLGLVLCAPSARIAVPGFLILFRETFVSGLREGLAPRGVRIPVTRLAKWKTTLQLAALTLEILSLAAPGSTALRWTADLLLDVAAAVTLVTGWQYLAGGARALRAPA